MSQNRRDIDRRIGDPEFDGSFRHQPPNNPLDVAKQILRRGRLWLRVLTVATCLAWLAAIAASVLLAAYWCDGGGNIALREYEMAKAYEAYREVRDQPESSAEKKERRENYHRRSQNLSLFYGDLMMRSQATIVLAGIAAFLSVWLVIASRRVSLKQINVSLATLSEHLEILVNAPSQGEQSLP